MDDTFEPPFLARDKPIPPCSNEDGHKMYMRLRNIDVDEQELQELDGRCHHCGLRLDATTMVRLLTAATNITPSAQKYDKAWKEMNAEPLDTDLWLNFRESSESLISIVLAEVVG